MHSDATGVDAAAVLQDRMTFVPSLLQAIVAMDGDALVMHVGDKPYVVTERGQSSLGSDPLTAEAIAGVLEHLLPEESRRVLDEVGATQCVLPENPLFPRERFSVVAARGGDDVWVEIRRTELRRRAKSGPAPSLPSSPASTREGPRSVVDIRARQTETAREDEAPTPAIVLPLTRTTTRSEASTPLLEPALARLDRLVRTAVARGASTIYLVSGARPTIRVDGDIRTLDGTAVLSSSDVESLLLTQMPERGAHAFRRGAAGEWTSELTDIGRVRYQSFRDHRGPGGVLHIMPQRATTVEQLGLSREIEELVDQSEGLLLVTGPRQSGKRTLMSALVDHINRTRHVHVITIERDINVVHERIGSLVSQREARDEAAMAGLLREALREDPDVLVIEEVRTTEVAGLALEASAAGRLVICGLPARSAAAAIDGFIDLSPAGDRHRTQLSLSRSLTGVVAQVLLKKTGGGRLAARELL
ncbi:MAG: ATPase, T2SS/T4P/T4SS family, partial [Vicinamibacterales bacterium]